MRAFSTFNLHIKTVEFHSVFAFLWNKIYEALTKVLSPFVESVKSPAGMI